MNLGMLKAYPKTPTNAKATSSVPQTLDLPNASNLFAISKESFRKIGLFLEWRFGWQNGRLGGRGMGGMKRY